MIVIVGCRKGANRVKDHLRAFASVISPGPQSRKVLLKKMDLLYRSLRRKLLLAVFFSERIPPSLSLVSRTTIMTKMPSTPPPSFPFDEEQTTNCTYKQPSIHNMASAWIERFAHRSPFIINANSGTIRLPPKFRLPRSDKKT